MAVRTASTTEAARSAAVAELGIVDAPREEQFDRIVDLARQIFDVPMAAINVITGEREWRVAEVGLGSRTSERSQSFCATAVEQERLLVVEDARRDGRFAERARRDGIRFYAGEPLRAPGGGSIGTLCIMDTEPRTLTPQQTKLLKELASWVERELVLRLQLERAGDVQRLLMPQTAPALDGYELAGAYAAAQQVGGDFYDWYLLPDGHLHLALADVMGHNLSAALVAASLRATLRGASLHNDTQTTVNMVGRVLEQDLDEIGVFATVLTARLDPSTGDLRYVDAGHGLAGIVTDDGDHRWLRSSGPPVGAVPSTTWQAHSEHLEPGETLVLVSDGYLDLVGGTDEAQELTVAANRESSSARELIERFDDFARARTAGDDRTVVALRRSAT